MTKDLTSIAETHHHAAIIAGEIKDLPAVVLLTGEVGAGKTEWVKGFVNSYLGDSSQVTSPTYSLINEYTQNEKKISHVDLYRISGPEDLESVGFWDLFLEAQVVLVEWAQVLSEEKFDVPVYRVEISLSKSGERTISYKPTPELP